MYYCKIYSFYVKKLFENVKPISETYIVGVGLNIFFGFSAEY